MICASCGTENAAGSRFCDNCAAPLMAPCPVCGQPNRPDARFCRNCASSLRPDGAPGPTPLPPISAESQPTAERRLVSVLFADLVGFTTLAEDRDPESVRELLNRYFESASAVVERHGGTIEKFIGDAVMAVWGTPIAHEDDAERAVRSALELVDAIRALRPDLEARAGVLTGEAAVTVGAQNQGMVAGDLVNTAARLQGVAEPGTVLVGESTMLAASRAILFEEVATQALKGKTTPVPAWRALRVVAQRGGQGRADALEPPFVGRDEELRQLKEHLHSVGREQRVRLVSITGPGGIGKSRLVWELEKYVDGVAEPIYWHRGRSPSYGEGITFWALGEMVRRRAGLAEDDDEATTRARVSAKVAEFLTEPAERELVEPALLALLGVEPAPAAGRDALFPAWRLFFERIAARGTTVLVFEDLQWADSGLLDFIDHLVEWSRALPIMVVTLARPELFDRRTDWGAGRRNFVSMALEPLRDEAMRELLAGLVPGLPEQAVAAIIGRAEGVPLYAVETVRALLTDGRITREGESYRPAGDLSDLSVPESLRSLIASRLDALETDDRSLLQTAAVLGQVFSASTLGAVVGAAEADLEPRLRGLVRRELLELETDPTSPERGQYRFVQSLIREVAYGTLGRRDRRARHLAAARHFESVGDEELAGALASHYLAAHAASDEGAEADAVAAQARLALRAAAERAAALGAPDHAVAYLEQALSITRDALERGELLTAAALSGAMAARADAVRFAAEAVEAYRTVGDEVAAARASAIHGRVLLDASEIAEAATVLEASLAVVPSDAPEAEADLAANLARVYMRLARFPEAVETADRALVIAERLNLDDVIAEALINKGSALTLTGRRREGIALLEAAVRLAEGGSSVAREIRARFNLAGQAGDDGPLKAIELYESILELARRVGDRGHYNWVVGSLTPYRIGVGVDWDDQIALIREALETTTLPYDRARLRAMLGLIESARGEGLESLVAEIDAIVGDAADGDPQFIKRMARAVTAYHRGEYDSAYRFALEAGDLQTQIPQVPLNLAMDAAIALRDLPRALEVHRRVKELPFSDAISQAMDARDAAAVAALEGRRAEAVTGFRDARNRLRALGVAFDEALVAVDALTLAPDEPEVVAWAEDARATFERLRARPYLERLDALLAAVHTRPGVQAVARAAQASEVTSA